MLIQDFLRNNEESTPSWFASYEESSKPISNSDLITSFMQSRTVFYPGSGLDGHPISIINKSRSAHCYIYADFGVDTKQIESTIENQGFAGYHQGPRFELKKRDFGFWRPTLTRITDSKPSQKSFVPYSFIQFFERDAENDDTHGANRFAVMFLGADGHAAYDALYCQNNGSIHPFITVIQDHSCGGNYSKFGRNGRMNQIASAAKVHPDFLLVSENSIPWENYDHCFVNSVRIQSSIGGQHKNQRFLMQRK